MAKKSSLPGVMVMLHMLRGYDKGMLEAYNAALGKEIASITLSAGSRDDDTNALHIFFVDGSGIVLTDEGQQCCELRHMSTDDDLDQFAGDTLLGIEIAPADDLENEWGEVHEVQFLRVLTNRGTLTVANHNEHNGYYGGFWITVREIQNDN